MQDKISLECYGHRYPFQSREAAFEWLCELGVERDPTKNVEDQIRIACRWLHFYYTPGVEHSRTSTLQEREAEHFSLNCD